MIIGNFKSAVSAKLLFLAGAESSETTFQPKGKNLFVQTLLKQYISLPVPVRNNVTPESTKLCASKPNDAVLISCCSDESNKQRYIHHFGGK